MIINNDGFDAITKYKFSDLSLKAYTDNGFITAGTTYAKICDEYINLYNDFSTLATDIYY